jgi:hypothetical protein
MTRVTWLVCLDMLTLPLACRYVATGRLHEGSFAPPSRMTVTVTWDNT